MRRPIFPRAALTTTLALAGACKPPFDAPVEDPTVLPPKEPDLEDPTPVPPDEQGPDAALAIDEERDKQRLIERFCHHGGDYFAPPTNTPYPPADEWDWQPGDPLSSCDEIHATLEQRLQTPQGTAALYRLAAVVEDADGYGPGLIAIEDFVTIRSEGALVDHRATTFEVNLFEEAPDEDVEVEALQLRNILGGPAPDFIGIRTHEVGDCYECDFCYSQSQTITSLLLCGDHPQSPGCIDIPLSHQSTTAPRQDPDDCDEKPAPDTPPSTHGFQLHYTIPNHNTLTLDHTTPQTTTNDPITPPLLGPQKINPLFTSPNLRSWSH